MSPEQATAQEVDGRSDIYSLACVLYEMVGGNPPFTATTPTAILARKLSEPVPSLKVVRKTVPDELEHVVMKALEQVPADRYSTAAEFMDALTDQTASVAPPMSRTLVGWNVPFAAVFFGIVAVAAVAFTLSKWLIYPTLGDTGGIERIAVMPCANRTNDPNQEPIVLGLHDEIIAGLGRVADVSVRGSRSVARYAESDMTVSEISDALGVEGFVECSVYLVADSVRVSASLRDGARDEQLWSGSFAREPGRLFDLAADVIREIATVLTAEYAPAEGTQLASRLTTDATAYRHYQQGRFLQFRSTEDELRRAIEHFDEAIALDSSFAAAYSAKAEAIMWLGDVLAVSAGTSPIEWMPEVRRLVERALDIDQNLADAHRVLGFIRWSYDYDYEGAIAAARLSTELAPNDPMNWDWYGQALSVMGPEYDEEAIAASRRAVALEPAEPTFWSDLSGIYFPARAYDDAIAAARTAIDLDPSFSIAYLNEAVALSAQGRHEEALDVYVRANQLSPHPVYTGLLGAAHAFAGDRQEAERILRELTEMAQQRFVPPRSFTALYFSLGYYDDAIVSLLRSVELRDRGANLWDIRSEFFAPLRDHPRYPEVLRAMKLDR
jgi:serine/threonine-protein kinase